MIAIIDYGLGNIQAFSNIFKRLNIPCVSAQKPEDLVGVEKLILPGVGAYDYAMQRLEASGLRAVLDELVLEKRVPVLGVCVGMQIMGCSSEEGEGKGLGWIEGQVVEINTESLNHKPRLPHMGWNSISPKVNSNLFNQVEVDHGFYFLHSYCFECKQPEHVLATTNYGQSIVCAIHRDNIYGFQFHPEKSLENGINLLRNFAGI